MRSTRGIFYGHDDVWKTCSTWIYALNCED